MFHISILTSDTGFLSEGPKVFPKLYMNATFEMQLIPQFLAGPWHTAKCQSSVDANQTLDIKQIATVLHFVIASLKLIKNKWF